MKDNLPSTYQHFIIFKAEDDKVEVDVRFQDETILTLDQMSALFDRDKSTISRHIKNIFDEGKLEYAASVAKFATVQTEGTYLFECDSSKNSVVAHYATTAYDGTTYQVGELSNITI